MTHLPSRPVAKTAFGEAATAEKTPQVQIKFPYGLNTDIVELQTNNASSTVTSTGGYAIVTCAGATESHSQLKSRDNIRYGPGQGAQTMFTCAWISGGVVNSTQIAGCGNGDEGFFFGYEDTTYGILSRSLGVNEIKNLAISNAASGTGNITITMDGTAVTVAITSGWTVSQIVEAIVAETTAFGNAGRGWTVHSDDDVNLQLISFVAENAGGAFTFVDTDTTGVAGVFSELISGVAPTDTWVAQSAWNRDKMDGTGASRMNMNKTLLNVFCIQFQYLGAGPITYQVEESPGNFITVHVIEYPNTAQIPSLVNPTLHLSLIAQTNASYSGGTLEMRTASMGGFIEGKETLSGIRRGKSESKTMSTTQNVLMILHNHIVFNSLVNKVSAFPDFITLSTEASKPVTIIIWANPTRIDGGSTLTDVDTDISVMQHGQTGSTINGGAELAIFTIEAGAPVQLDFSAFQAQIRPGERWVITGEVSSGTSAKTTAGINWLERI